ncbi:hypothetical protein BDQ17DRAFT_770467 [Cyathus striatus]|nr:hypothetical protein BDQ17DRAFT_770467 [Cyathus striatus]
MSLHTFHVLVCVRARASHALFHPILSSYLPPESGVLVPHISSDCIRYSGQYTSLAACSIVAAVIQICNASGICYCSKNT